jgi:predicted nucleic acid-binding protein
MNEDPTRSEIIRQLVRDAQNGESRIVISTLVLAEVKPSSTHETEARRVIEDLFATHRPYLRIYALTRRIALLARDIGVQCPRLSGADCVHVATAIHAQADVMLTYDGHSNLPLNPKWLLFYDRKIGDPPLRIEVPSVRYGPLFDAASGKATTEE